MRDNEYSIIWVWRRKVRCHLMAMIPVGIIFITKQPQRTTFLSTVFSCKLTAALLLCTVVTFVSESQLLNCKPRPNARSVNITFYCFRSELL